MEKQGFNGLYVVVIVLVAFVALAIIVRNKRKKL